MKKDDFNIIGVMSGTSLDGIDIANLHFYKENNLWQFEIIQASTYEYAPYWYQKLNDAFGYNSFDLKELNLEYTKYLASQIQQFISSNSITEIDAVCSHGHTIFHKPNEGITIQIGNLPEIAELLQKTVVCDFRVQDVQLGGQGAPLVPIGDKLLFSEYDYCLNLGGFSNISMDVNGQRIAFDISPVNIVLNYYAEKIGLPYDDGGKLAKSGNINEKLLQQLNAIAFYQKHYPKSLGKEFIATEILPLIDIFNLTSEDILRTFVEHIAIQVTNVVQTNSKVLVTGGGAYNTFLLERFKSLKSDVNWILPNDKIIQFKEALIFGFLGVLRLRNEVNVLASVTGATQNHSSGNVFEFPKKSMLGKL